MNQPLVDSHAHLADSDFDEDREVVVERARLAGLRYLLVIGGGPSPEELGKAIALADRYDWVYAAAGLHPHEAAQFENRQLDELRKLAHHPKVLALGEMGLDYHYDHSPREVQKDVLIRQLEVGREVKQPVIIHCREAWADLGEIIRAHWRSTARGGILHCFTGSREDAFKFMEWGFLISFAGNVTFKNAESLRAVAREIPPEYLLTETDSPYLAPLPHRGKRNEPANVSEVTRTLATLHHITEEEMGQQAVRNFSRLFRL